MKKISLVLAALVALGISSCKKNDDNNSTPQDTTKPSASLASPSDKDEFTSGNKINVMATITDDVELSQAKIEIHENFDGHSHMKNGSPAFEWDSIIDLSGKSATLNFSINLPVDIAAGNYHFTMKVLDKSGNEADFVEADIKLKNADDLVAPTLNVTATPGPDGSGEIHLHGGDKEITLVGSASDDKGLKAYEIKLIHEGTEVNYLDRDGTFSGTSGGFTEKVVFESSWPKGEYELIIEAFDLKNNDADVEFHVHWD
jgi:autotransporter translocation and assembly factor TamB